MRALLVQVAAAQNIMVVASKDVFCLSVQRSMALIFVERFPELSPFFKACRAFYDEMICIFPYFCPYAESAREIRGIFVALHQ